MKHTDELNFFQLHTCLKSYLQIGEAFGSEIGVFAVCESRILISWLVFWRVKPSIDSFSLHSSSQVLQISRPCSWRHGSESLVPINHLKFIYKYNILPLFLQNEPIKLPIARFQLLEHSGLSDKQFWTWSTLLKIYKLNLKKRRNRFLQVEFYFNSLNPLMPTCKFFARCFRIPN